MSELNYVNLENNVFEDVKLDKLMGLINSSSPVAVFFAFESCPWCYEYINYLNKVALDWEIDTIYYFNPKHIGLMDSDENLKKVMSSQYYDDLIRIIGAEKATDLDHLVVSGDSSNKFAGIDVPYLYIFQEGRVLGSYSGPETHNMIGYELPKLNELEQEELISNYKSLLSLVK